jgi:hypothetical protein
MISLILHVETSVGHVQVTVKRNEVFGCRLYWRDAVGNVPCVYCIMSHVQRVFSKVWVLLLVLCDCNVASGFIDGGVVVL